MGHEDFMLAAQVVATALCRLWQAPIWDSTSIHILSEVIADNAFTKVNDLHYLHPDDTHYTFFVRNKNPIFSHM